MSAKKFLGKIRTDPWEALAKGPREVMAALWREYLGEALGMDPGSRRAVMLRREIEEAAGFKQIERDWPNLTPEERAAAWGRLMAGAREVVRARQEECLRCGECCEKGSPTLLAPDLILLAEEVLNWSDVYTLRIGEQVTSREGTVTTLQEERLKVREVPGSRQCSFYLAATNTCRIYEKRPEQCRRQECWGEPAPPPETGEFLHRGQLFERVPEVWELITAHRDRCDLAKVSRALADLEGGREEAGDLLFDALHFDHYLRQTLREDWQLSEAAAELLLGRPLPEFLRSRGYDAILGPEGTFRLTRREGGE